MKCQFLGFSLTALFLSAYMAMPEIAKALPGALNQALSSQAQRTLGEQVPTRASLSPEAPFDSSIDLNARLMRTPDTVLQRIRSQTGIVVTAHELSSEEHTNVENVLKQLPDFSRQALARHVRSISFLDGLPSNGITLKEEDSSGPVFNIVLRADILEETISHFLTRKERSGYSDSTSGESVSVEAGSFPALLYVLLHETIHITDISIRAGQVGPPQLSADGNPNQLVQGIWTGATTLSPEYGSPLLLSSWFRTGKRENIDLAQLRYQALAQTPFVSLYGSSNWYDDIAELVTCYYLTQRLHQPYRIVLSKGTQVLYSLQPMASKLVVRRFALVEPLFDEQTVPR